MKPLKERGIDIPKIDLASLPQTDLQEHELFWRDYFSKLGDCPWFPKQNLKETSE